MIITIDTDKESPQRLRQAARFLEQLASREPARTESADDFSFSEDAFSAVFDPEPEEKPPRRDDDDFRIMPY